MWKKSGHLFFTALKSILSVHGELGNATKVEPPMWVNINASLTMNSFDTLLNIHVASLCLQPRVCSQCVCSDLDDSEQSSGRLVEQSDAGQMLPCNKREAFSHSLWRSCRSAASSRQLAKLLLLLWMSARASIITDYLGKVRLRLNLKRAWLQTVWSLLLADIFMWSPPPSPQNKIICGRRFVQYLTTFNTAFLCHIFYQINCIFYSPSYFHDISEAPILFRNVALTRKTTDYSKNKLAILGHFAPASRHNFTATSLGFNASCVRPYVTTTSFLCSCRLQWKALNSQRS